jgi:hypothetical protein
MTALRCADCVKDRTFPTVTALGRHRQAKHGEPLGVLGNKVRAERRAAELRNTQAAEITRRQESARQEVRDGLTPREVLLAEALEGACGHLDFIGWGDSYERECADGSGLREQIEAALKASGARP